MRTRVGNKRPVYRRMQGMIYFKGEIFINVYSLRDTPSGCFNAKKHAYKYLSIGIFSLLQGGKLFNNLMSNMLQYVAMDKYSRNIAYVMKMTQRWIYSSVIIKWYGYNLNRYQDYLNINGRPAMHGNAWQINTMAAYVLASCVVRYSASMVLTMSNM